MSGSAAGKGSVCIVRHSFYPFELNVKREAEALLEDGFSVHVVCLRGEGEAAREVVDGVEVHRMPVGHRRGKISRYLIEYNAFYALAKLRLIALHLRHRFRAIQVNTMPDYLVFSTLLPRLLGAKIVLHMHEPMPELFATMFPPRKARLLLPLIRLSERLSLRYAHGALTVTREMRDNFGLRGADVNKITVIVNVPDDRSFRLDRYEEAHARLAARKREERRRGAFRVLTHGAVEERYGQDLVVRAVAQLRKEIPGIEFRFMGGGSHVDEVVRLARELGVEDRVHFLGFVPFETMVEEILAADVTVVPMKANPYSVLVHTNKMYEYVALQRPVVASRLASVASYFPDDSLVYFTPGDAADLARAIRHVYAHPEETAARIDAATAVYETYRWSRERKKYLGVYHALLGE
ncbi:MAG: glycosyltransferase family 4 protein [Candidatus Krumholzibacteria bacterium]|nr:glycosyltransferase family 4 protein [Candidatus Krumholzibacteria bacterium]